MPKTHIWNVRELASGSVSRDGRTITLRFSNENGSTGELVLSHDQFDLVAQRFMQLANAIYDIQALNGYSGGAIDPTSGSMAVEATRALVNNQDRTVIVQMTGRTSTGPTGMQSALLDEVALKNLSDRLLECLEQMKQTSRPS